MNVIASRAQLRASLLRWALFTVPAVMLLGFLGGRVGTPQTQWFRGLVKPELYPEPVVFGLVWTILYLMIGLAVAVVASSWGARGRGLALGLFAIHFLLSISWHGVFFGAQEMHAALYLLIAIVLSLLVVIAAFWRVRRLAGLLLLPYLAWVAFATLLNYQFIEANPDGGQSPAPAASQRIQL